MKTVTSTTRVISSLLMLFITVGFAQETGKKSLGEAVYNEYQANGVEAAIEKYHQLKKDTTRYEVGEWELNNVAYRLMNEEKDMDAAEKVFLLNIEEYPKAANPYDSYGEFLVKKGDDKKAIEYFEKSMAIAEKSNDPVEKDQLYPSTKGKVAKLEKKDRQLDMLIGDWKVDAIGYKDGREMTRLKGVDKIEYVEEANALFFYHQGENKEPEGVRIVAYDAVDDEFDVAYLNPNSLQGIQTSKMKMEKKGENSFEFIDRYQTRAGKEMVMRHELQKLSDNELEWVIFEKNGQDEWQRVFAMNMTK